jgi:N-acetylglucosamine repressor
MLPWPSDSTHALVLNLIRSNAPIARNRLAQITCLSPSTVTHIVRDLRAENLVLECGTEPTGRVGRDPIQLELNQDVHAAIGIQIGDSRLIGLLLNLRGDVQRRILTPIPPQSKLRTLTPLVAQVVDELSRDQTSVLGIGIAVAGMINRAEGTVFAPNLHDGPVDLAKALTERLHRLVVVENEANAMLLAEQTFGVLRAKSNALSVNVGLGVGGGVLVDGEVYSGDNGGAGEIGHTIVQIDGPLCNCGSRGCLEAFSGGKALARALRLDEESDPTVDLLRESALADSDSQYHLETAARVLGIGLANAANAFNPEIIVCGGSHFAVYHSVMEVLTRSFRHHVLPNNRGITLCEVSLSEPEALGAGIMILNRFFGAPPESADA